jgi:hypothetical protein
LRSIAAVRGRQRASDHAYESAADLSIWVVLSMAIEEQPAVPR